jgi:hypothetical protein
MERGLSRMKLTLHLGQEWNVDNGARGEELKGARDPVESVWTRRCRSNECKSLSIPLLVNGRSARRHDDVELRSKMEVGLVQNGRLRQLVLARSWE